MINLNSIQHTITIEVINYALNYDKSWVILLMRLLFTEHQRLIRTKIDINYKPKALKQNLNNLLILE